jgi:hypothetical protein
LPPAVTRVRDRQSAGIFADLHTEKLKPEALAASAGQGKAWVTQNFKTENSDRRWTFYYLYGLERFMSLMELVEGTVDDNPGWYNAVFAYLQGTQKPNGSWESGFIPTPVDTAFGVLVLLRSMQKTIEKAALGEGILIGGKGLPKDLTNARMVDCQVVTPQMIRDVDDLLDLVNSAEDKEFDPKSLPGGVSLDVDLTKRTSQLERLREMVTNKDYAARLLAVKTLAKARELDNVPALIYALGDPDARIREEARDGLRFISRKFEGFGPGEADADKAKESVARWKAWYVSIRPDAEFLD